MLLLDCEVLTTILILTTNFICRWCWNQHNYLVTWCRQIVHRAVAASLPSHEIVLALHSSFATETTNYLPINQFEQLIGLGSQGLYQNNIFFLHKTAKTLGDHFTCDYNSHVNCAERANHAIRVHS